MLAAELISSSITTISTDTPGIEALKYMEEIKVMHLPIVEKQKYFGIISENEILDWENTDEVIKDHIYNLAKPHVFGTQHLFDIIKELEENSLSIVPVLNDKNEYLGSISNRKILYTIAKSSSVKILEASLCWE